MAKPFVPTSNQPKASARGIRVKRLATTHLSCREDHKQALIGIVPWWLLAMQTSNHRSKIL